MSKKAAEIAARMTALKQRLLVAVLQGDDHARSLARGEMAGLKRRLPPTAGQERRGRSAHTGRAPAPVPAP